MVLKKKKKECTNNNNRIMSFLLNSTLYPILVNLRLHADYTVRKTYSHIARLTSLRVDYFPAYIHEHNEFPTTRCVCW